MVDRLAVVGCGLIGGSFALALREAQRIDQVVVFDRDPAHAERARTLGIADRVASSIADAVDGASLVVVATPVAQIEPVFAAIANHLRPDAVVTDVGSTKRDVVAAARRTLGDALPRFVPGHPIAGRAVHGPEAATADLFRGKRVLLTPHDTVDADALARARDAWLACGAHVTSLTADAHDRVLSAVSHLPHLLAYVLVAQIAEADDAAQKFELAGGGFADFTRIAASSPEMWRDIALANRDALLEDLDDYRRRLDVLRSSVARGDGVALETLFSAASAARTEWRKAG